MSYIKHYDSIFVILSAVLLIFGLFILTSASLGISAARFGSPYYYILHQFIAGVIPGIILFYISSRIPYFYWRNYALTILLVAIFLTFLVFVPGIGFYHSGAKRWLSLGPASFQPSELLKFAYIIYLAAWLESKSKSIRSFKFGFLPFAIMTAFIASFLVLQPDIGTLIVLMAATLGLFFVSGGSVKQVSLLAGLMCIIFVVLIAAEPYRLDRVKVFFNTSHDPQGVGYQINQAFIAIGSGGFWGRGFGLSRQKFNYLPEPIGDSIFAVAAEELGFLGSMILLMLFAALFLRGLWLSLRVSDGFGQFLGTGIIFLITAQAITNIAAIVGLVPLTGIPLSLISYGGSALLVTLTEMGIILNISKYRT